MAELTAKINLGAEMMRLVEEKIAAAKAEMEQLKQERDEAWAAWKAERDEKLRLAEVALSYGCHRAGCIHEQQNDCNCGLWRELGMVT